MATGPIKAPYPSKTATTLLNRTQAVSGNTDWQNNSGTVDISQYTSLVIRVAPHGALANCGEIDMRTLNAIGSFTVNSYWNTNDRGQLSIDKNGNWSITCKTQNMTFDYILYGVK